MPPTAAVMGNAAFLIVESSPDKTSRLISRPITKKNIPIKPSLIQ